MHAHEPFRSEEVTTDDRREDPAAYADAATDRIWYAQAGRLRVCVDPTEDGGATVWVAGELDLAGAHLIDDALRMVSRSRRRHVRLDVRAVSFCDCAGLNALIASDQVLRAAGGRLTLVHPSAQVRWLLNNARMDRFREFNGTGS